MSQTRVGLLLKTFPKLSETFVLEEILGLERLGVPLHIFSLNRPAEDLQHAANASVRARVDYPPAGLGRRWLAHLTLALRRPLTYLRALAFALVRQRAGAARCFSQAVCMAGPLGRAGITHLHTHFISEPTAVAEILQRLTGVGYSISAHAKDIYLSEPASLKRKMSGARFTVTCTEYNRAHLAGIADDSGRVHRMYHGVDLRRFCCDEHASKDVPPLILSVGRLRTKKGFPILIEACRALHRAGLAFRCEIVGYGEERERLASLITQYDLDDCVELCGKMAHEALIERYRAARLFVLPCVVAEDGDRDGIPNVLLEAMASGVPVVSTDVSGIPEVVVREQTGLSVAANDAHALAQAMRRVLEDPALARRLAHNARRKVEAAFCNDVNLLMLRDLLERAARQTLRGAPARGAQAWQHG